MKANIYLVTGGLCLMTMLSGCSESATLGQGVNTIVSGVSDGIQNGLGISNKSSQKAKVTDWTPYLKPMQNGCDYPYMSGKVPAQYKASIKSVDTKGTPDSSMEEVIYTYNLQNAVAFGYPLQKIEYLQGYEWSHLKLVFKEDSFTALRPSFKTPKITEYMVIEKNDSSGYEGGDGGYLFLHFDTKEKSITCGSGV